MTLAGALCWLLPVLAAVAEEGTRELPLPGGGRMEFRAVYLGVGDGPEAARRFWTGGDPVAGTRWEVVLGWAFVGEREGRRDWLYYMGRTEVSRGQWAAVMGTGSGTQEPDRPKTGVGWFGVQKFLERYNRWLAESAQGKGLPWTRGGALGVVRLPTEVEWEHAARGGVEAKPDVFAAGRAYALEETDLYEVASRSGVSGVERVGSRRANALGLYDMLGNASEMVLDGFRVVPGVGRMGGWWRAAGT